MALALEDQELLHDFLSEAGEMLDDVDIKLLELERQPQNADLLNAVFRGFHTVKGGAGFLGVTPLVELCHRGENLLDALRKQRLQLNPTIMDVVLEATTEVRRMFGALAHGSAPDPANPRLLVALDAALQGPMALQAGPALQTAVQSPHGQLDLARRAANAPDWHALYAQVAGLGRTALPHAQPTPPVCTGTQALGSTCATSSAASAGWSAPPHASPFTATSTSPSASQAISSAPSAAKPPQRPAEATARDQSLRIDLGRFDQILNLAGEIGLVKNRMLYLREDIRRGHDAERAFKTLDQMIGQLGLLVSDLQRVSMKARMQPMSQVFQKYLRMARDLARQLDKDVEFVIEASGSELDKTLLDELNDPLVHLVRNALDHGVETRSEREAAGKPATARVTLSARQTGDSIVIELTDDGRGIDAAVIRRKAVAKGLLTEEAAAQLTEAQSLELIMLPGFSTREQVSDLSGRGVGMDVVRTNIQRLSGRIDIHSVAGQGSCFSIVMPLTLAILPVLMVRVSGQALALPLATVHEVVEFASDTLPRPEQHDASTENGPPHADHQPDNTAPMATDAPLAILEMTPACPTALPATWSLRGHTLPVFSLSSLLGWPSAPDDPSAPAPVGVIIQAMGRAAVLSVDALLGREDVVIKPIELLKPRGVAGATLSREGQLVLVLEMRELLPD